PRGELRLVDEHLRELRVMRELGEDLFDDAEARRAEIGVGPREENLGHPPFADEVEERVAPELARQASGSGGGFCGGDAGHAAAATSDMWRRGKDVSRSGPRGSSRRARQSGQAVGASTQTPPWHFSVVPPCSVQPP